MLALTSLTSGGRLVCIVRTLTQATEYESSMPPMSSATFCYLPSTHVVTWTEVRAVRIVFEQVPDEMLQQCLSTSSYTGCQQSVPFVLDGRIYFCTLLTLLWSLKLANVLQLLLVIICRCFNKFNYSYISKPHVKSLIT
jgi:hypothetical protein